MMARPSRQPGFTLIEVLVTLLLLAVVLPVVMSGVSLSLRAAEDSRSKAQASLPVMELMKPIFTGAA